MRMAVQHLAELGHERIGLALGQRRFVPVLRKLEGFAAACAELLGQSEQESAARVQHTLFSVEGGHAAAAALLDADCTAVVCGSDLMAFG